MANQKLRFGFREPTIDMNRPLSDGSAPIAGFDIVCSNFESPELVDAWDASFGGLMTSLGKGSHPYVSIPAYPNRKFRLAYIFTRTAAKIDSPKDLEGKRVGIFAWDNTATLWSRGALKHHYGVDFSKIEWFLPGSAGRTWAPDVTVKPLLLSQGARDAAMDEKLLTGELDAVLGPNVLPSISRKDPRTRRLFPDYRSEEQAYFKATGIFPISHVVSFNRTFLERHPNASVALLRAYRKARDVAFDRIYGSDPEIVSISWAAAMMDEQRAVMGENYWPYNVSDNLRSLQAMMEYAYEFGVTPTRLNHLDLFDAAAVAEPGQ